MKNLLILFLVILVFQSCKKEEVPDCETNENGTLIIRNDTNDIFEIYLDGVSKKIINDNTTDSLIIDKGFYTFEFVRITSNSGLTNGYTRGISIGTCTTEETVLEL